MTISYDDFTASFLEKIREYEFLSIPEENRITIIDGYMQRALNSFKKSIGYDFFSTKDDANRLFDFREKSEKEKETLADDIDDIVDIVSDGMVLQWLKPFKNNQENLESVLNTRDFTTYSPAELLRQISGVYNETKKEYIQRVREYSYDHMDLGALHT